VLTPNFLTLIVFEFSASYRYEFIYLIGSNALSPTYYIHFSSEIILSG